MNRQVGQLFGFQLSNYDGVVFVQCSSSFVTFLCESLVKLRGWLVGWLVGWLSARRRSMT
eukprot:NODE_2674_length_884_cov_67.155689_g2203_i0.p4 GENE.NODE_2674_length_884_cov_67.155689_g2203_i0~~NODE_2674_length_884_cov_67.155689_g2203_i0.p4  ORF type:complete len:60 (+),score=2.39 NODE_2674_length_884_cov_67.155689_g2203_i0:358-537(+)